MAYHVKNALMVGLLVTCVLGCTRGRTPITSGSTDGGGGSEPGTVRISPEDATVAIVGGAVPSVDYQVFLTVEDGSEEEVTAEATLSLSDASFGTFAAAKFTPSGDRTGRVSVIASVRGFMGSTGLTVQREIVLVEEGAPPDSRTRFMAEEVAGSGPTLVYPAEAVLLPPNLRELEIHFHPNDATLFELEFHGTASLLRVYFDCESAGSGCVYTTSDTVWDAMIQDTRGREGIRYRVRGLNADGTVGASEEQTLGFATEDIQGGIYYWNAGAGAIRRFEFGRRGQDPDNYLDARQTGAMTCVGCHTLSRDGSRIAVGLDIPGASPYQVLDTATRDRLYQQGSFFGGGASFFAFSPDASQIMTSDGNSIVLRDSDDGTPLVEPLVALGTQPNWSPDGTRMVYAKPSSAAPCVGPFCAAGPGVDGASLETMILADDSWSGGPSLVGAGGANNYYPAYSPDGNWVLFNRSAANNNSYDAPDAELWVVPADGGDPVRLAEATSAHGDSWPTWDPTVYEHGGRPLMWLSVSSRRPFGVRLSAGQQAQIWMGAFDPSRGELAYPLLRLPFQEIDSGNHIAQWVTSVDRQPCSAPGDCAGGEFCEDGICNPDLR